MGNTVLLSVVVAGTLLAEAVGLVVAEEPDTALVGDVQIRQDYPPDPAAALVDARSNSTHPGKYKFSGGLKISDKL